MQYVVASARTSVIGGCTTAPAYEPVAMRWASRLAWAPVKEAFSVVEMSAETSSDTPDDATSLPGTSIRQPPKATAAIVRPIVRAKREDIPPCIGRAR